MGPRRAAHPTRAHRCNRPGCQSRRFGDPAARWAEDRSRSATGAGRHLVLKYPPFGAAAGFSGLISRRAQIRLIWRLVSRGRLGNDRTCIRCRRQRPRQFTGVLWAGAGGRNAGVRWRIRPFAQAADREWAEGLWAAAMPPSWPLPPAGIAMLGVGLVALAGTPAPGKPARLRRGSVRPKLL
jgi:hypothetical protein